MSKNNHGAESFLRSW